jgi:hypothetical protein
MEKFGISGRDLGDLPPSSLKFPDGAHYRMEISGVERPSTMEAIIEESQKRKISIHKLICTVLGSTLLDRSELRSMAKMGALTKTEMVITPGPRASWDTGRQCVTPSGALSGLRLRGSEGLRQYIEEVMRCIELGFRAFLVWDEGALWLLNEMRKSGDIPKDVKFKVSIFAGQANPAGVKVLESLGADTVNPVADLSVGAFAAIRKSASIPIDIHAYILDDFGGFNRFYEAAELARVTSPCYFKLEHGPSMALYKPWTPDSVLADIARERVKYAQIIHEMIQAKYPDLKLSSSGPKDLAVPKV